MDKVSIVIPTYNHWNLVHQVLFDVYKHCSSVHEIIVVNDGCTEPESFTGLEWWVDNKMLPVRELRLEQNVNFLRASNAGLKEATGDIVILLSNDVRVHKDIVSLARAGMIIEKKMLLGGKVYTQSTGWNEFDGKLFPYVEGWLLITTKENWEELGYFDERFAPADYEDMDLSTTAIEKGYALSQITPDNGAVVTHLVAQSLGYNPQRELVTTINREKFREKWITKKVSP